MTPDKVFAFAFISLWVGYAIGAWVERRRHDTR